MNDAAAPEPATSAADQEEPEETPKKAKDKKIKI